MTELSIAELEANVKDAETKLAEAVLAAAHQEFPKFVPVHESHIVRKEGVEGAPAVVSVPAFPEHHVDRDGAVTVLVTDADHEAKALAEAGAHAPNKEPVEGELIET